MRSGGAIISVATQRYHPAWAPCRRYPISNDSPPCPRPARTVSTGVTPTCTHRRRALSRAGGGWAEGGGGLPLPDSRSALPPLGRLEGLSRSTAAHIDPAAAATFLARTGVWLLLLVLVRVGGYGLAAAVARGIHSELLPAAAFPQHASCSAEQTANAQQPNSKRTAAPGYLLDLVYRRYTKIAIPDPSSSSRAAGGSGIAGRALLITDPSHLLAASAARE